MQQPRKSVDASVIWVVRFAARNAQDEEMDPGIFTFSSEMRAKAFVDQVVREPLERRINDLEEWQQREVRACVTLEEMTQAYFQFLDETGRTSLIWTIEVDIQDKGSVNDAREVFDFI